MGKPHVMIVPFPAQGHVIPLLELAQCLAKHGITITFVNTHIIHDRIFNNHAALLEDGIRLVSVPDGLQPEERYVPGKLSEAVNTLLPLKIEELLLREIEDNITCLVYDQSIGAIQKVADKVGIRSAAFLPAAAALLVLGFNIPNLIEDGIIDHQGTPLSNKPVQFAPTLPIMSPSDFVWHRIKIPTVQKLIFQTMIDNNASINSAHRLICNSIHNLEPGAFDIAPQVIPIGPLLASNRLASSAGHLWKPEPNCLEWLDQQPIRSVIYIAFGSVTMFNRAQFQELALGLEKADRPFLWVVRPGISSGLEGGDFPEGFLDRVSNQGKMVQWAPQQEVLSHGSIACFVSHCGWNSTVESVSNGVPILCWPYFADQFINQSYICDIWKVGLRLEHDSSSGNITCEEIKEKIDCLIGDDVFKERALELKEMIQISAREGGNSYNNLSNFISWIKE